MRDRIHAKDTVVAHCNLGESHFWLQDMLLGVVGHPLKKLGFAVHNLDAVW